MARVQMYRNAQGAGRGMKVVRAVALHEEVQITLRTHATKYYLRASAILRSHRDEGHSRITLEHGKVDWHVTLSDAGGAAYPIEQKIHALQRAFMLGRS